MNKKTILAVLSILIASSFITACTAQPTTTTEAPTIDANVIYTQAAQTVAAGQAMTQAAQPPTPTATVAEATATMDPNIATALTATANAVLQPGAGDTTAPTATLAANTTPLVLPTATKAVVDQLPANTGDKCEWVSNNPADNTKIPKSASFDTTIRVKNSGTTTWGTKYVLRFFAGDRMGAPSDFYVQGEVKPNQTYDFVFPMTAPSTTGKKEILFVVQNAEGRNMCFINIPLEIID